jgi:hypothetical protein
LWIWFIICFTNFIAIFKKKKLNKKHIIKSIK